MLPAAIFLSFMTKYTVFSRRGLVQAAVSAFVAGSESTVWRWADDSGRVTLSVDRTSFVYGVLVVRRPGAAIGGNGALLLTASCSTQRGTILRQVLGSV
eukprot:m.134320 g.134320  ORF g.134320 m.134320 type:complete len:99 (-) comp13862_c0_seq1:108-404(-)